VSPGCHSAGLKSSAPLAANFFAAVAIVIFMR
jgi:hypothetical protein